MSPEQAARKVQDWAAKEPLWAVDQTSADADGVQVQLVRRTPVFRFADDISLHIKSVDSGVVIEASSQSRIGKGDLGQNPRNLVELENAWQ